MLKDSFRKLMVYVGLAEDDYDELGRPAAPERQFASDRGYQPERGYPDEPRGREEPAWTPAPAPSATRPGGSVSVLDGGAGGYVQPQRPSLRPAAPSSSVRPITTLASEDHLQVLVPQSYDDSKRIGDDLKAKRPLVINLHATDADLSRRIIDFSSGVIYTLGGRIQRIASHAYLLVPPNTRVAPETIERLRNSGRLDA